MKTYSELITISTYEGRLEYLKLYDTVDLRGAYGRQFHVKDRRRWDALRVDIVSRDHGCDMAMPGVKIPEWERVIVHHINPVTEDMIKRDDPILYDPENLITVSGSTHNYVHYNTEPEEVWVPRAPGDNCPWKKGAT